VSDKATERRALEAACAASPIIPAGKIQDFEKPDFKIEAVSGLIGIEVTELLPPPTSEIFASPLQEKSFHQGVVQLAEQEYNRLPRAVPAGVVVSFWRIEDGKRDMRAMAHALAEFVRSHREQAKPVKIFSRLADLPEGFAVITIYSTYDRPWHAGEGSNLTSEQIHPLFAKRISEKNARLPTYRANLPDTPMILLIYSSAGVTRHVEIVHGMEEWEFAFDFDRVLFFSVLYNRVIEFGKSRT
jgi:hypothetical protein